MNKTLKIAMVIAMVFTFSSMVFASGNASSVVDNIDQKVNLDTASSSAQKLTEMAGKVISLIQIASVVLAVILIAVFGFKFIMGSANEKADYQKSFIPLIVGVVVVFAATSIAKLIMSIAA